MLPDTPDIVQYITANYRDAGKIVEIGIGAEDSVYKALKKVIDAEIIAVDVQPSSEIRFDDVFKPEREKYRSASLIYTIRPNPEIIPRIQKIAQAAGADLLIRPLSTDSCHKPKSMKLVNFGKAVLWEEKR
jgi:uncharacterized UPF0146 family protein